jgi:hypothetical protein
MINAFHCRRCMQIIVELAGIDSGAATSKRRRRRQASHR